VRLEDLGLLLRSVFSKAIHSTVGFLIAFAMQHIHKNSFRNAMSDDCIRADRRAYIVMFNGCNVRVSLYRDQACVRQ